MAFRFRLEQEDGPSSRPEHGLLRSRGRGRPCTGLGCLPPREWRSRTGKYLCRSTCRKTPTPQSVLRSSFRTGSHTADTGTSARGSAHTMGPLSPFGPSPEGEDRVFTFKLEWQDGTPADPPTLHTAVPNWAAGDTIPLGRDRALRVVDIGTDPDGEPVLVVEPG
jgi:hypothetical protein